MLSPLRPALAASLRDFQNTPLNQAAIAFWQTLGYESSRTVADLPTDVAGFTHAFGIEESLDSQSQTAQSARAIHFLFQLSDDEIKAVNSLFGQKIDRTRADSYLFFAIELEAGCYARGKLANIARELNKPFGSPILVLFRNGASLTLAVVDRRAHKLDASREVLEKVTLIQDIALENTHGAHLRILEELQLGAIRPNSWGELHRAWKSVLDLSALNRQFYRDYKAVFESVESLVPIDDATTRRDWTQRLFNRLMFVRFLEKKGWMRFEGSTDYLAALFAGSVACGETDFLNDRLYYTFFFGLGWAAEQEHLHSHEWLRAKRGDVPYLNGGLFEKFGAHDTQHFVKLPNAAFEPILALFQKYYFTVAESTPTEEEIGIDPEMLGKVFEELVTGRHESGSYYTPREIVSFMAREAIKGYLGASDVAPETIAALVDKGEVSVSVPQARVLLGLLENITVCDPACGSGAYLLGVVSELVRLYDLLEVTGHARTPRDDYERKLQIIAKSIYGVDKDEFAANIAMLRLWLSLVIDYRGETPEPLPNLKYKIEIGDSLAAPLGGQQTLDSETVAQFNDKKREYVSAHGAQKAQLESEIEKLRAELKQWSEVQGEAVHDWRIEFAEIFQNGGFDIVLANPPYVRQELITAQKPVLKKNFGTNFSGTADLYVYFYLRAHELLKDGGFLAFISPNKWFRAAYGARLRAHFAAHSRVQTIVDFGELKVFQEAATFPMIFVTQKGAGEHRANFTQVKSLAAPYPDVLELVKQNGARLPATAIKESNWQLADAATGARLERMAKSGTPLGDYVKGQIYRGVLTGFNEAFVIDEVTRLYLIKACDRSAELIKPMAKGDDVRRWRIEDKKRYLIVTKIGVEIEKYPAIFAHLKQWQPQLEKRTDQGNHWWELRACAYYDRFDESKIIFPDIMKEPRFCHDKKETFIANTAYMIPTDDLFLLGILNSQSVWEFAKQNFICIGDPSKGGRLRFIYQSVTRVPIPNAAASDKSAIESLVAACLAKKGVACAEEEAEINAIVAKLYGL